MFKVGSYLLASLGHLRCKVRSKSHEKSSVLQGGNCPLGLFRMMWENVGDSSYCLENRDEYIPPSTRSYRKIKHYIIWSSRDFGPNRIMNSVRPSSSEKNKEKEGGNSDQLFGQEGQRWERKNILRNRKDFFLSITKLKMNSGQLLFQNIKLNLLTKILLPMANKWLHFERFNFFPCIICHWFRTVLDMLTSMLNRNVDTHTSWYCVVFDNEACPSCHRSSEPTCSWI